MQVAPEYYDGGLPCALTTRIGTLSRYLPLSHSPGALTILLRYLEEKVTRQL